MYINHRNPLQTVNMLPHETLRGEKKADLAGAAFSIFRSAAGLWSARGADDTAVRHVWFTEVAPDDASSFQEVQNSQLADALKKESVFTRDEMQAFGIDMSFWTAERALDLKYCIYVDGKKLQMHAGDLASSAETGYPAPKRFRRSDRVLASTVGGITKGEMSVMGKAEDAAGGYVEKNKEDMEGREDDALDAAVQALKIQIREIQEKFREQAKIQEEIAKSEFESANDLDQVKSILERLTEIMNDLSEEQDSDTEMIFLDQKPDGAAPIDTIPVEPVPSPSVADTDDINMRKTAPPVPIKTEPDPTPPTADNDKPAFPSTATPSATDTNLQDIVTRAIHDGVAGALRDLNPEPSPTVEIPAPEPTELVLGHDYDFLASIAQSARFGKRVTPADVLCAGMAANLAVATARQMTFDYRRRFNAPAPNAEAMAMEDLSGYTREVLLAFRLLDVCLKPQWTRVGTQKRIELEFYSAVKDTVEATMSRR